MGLSMVEHKFRSDWIVYIEPCTQIRSLFFLDLPQDSDNRRNKRRWSESCCSVLKFLFFYRTQVCLGSDLWIRVSLSEYKSFLKQVMQVMQVMQVICKLCK